MLLLPYQDCLKYGIKYIHLPLNCCMPVYPFCNNFKTPKSTDLAKFCKDGIIYVQHRCSKLFDHSAATACSAVLFFFFFVAFSLRLPLAVLDVLMLLTLPLTLGFFFFLVPVVPDAVFGRPEAGRASGSGALGRRPSRLIRSCSSQRNRSSSSQKSSRNISQPSMNSPSMPPR